MGIQILDLLPSKHYRHVLLHTSSLKTRKTRFSVECTINSYTFYITILDNRYENDSLLNMKMKYQGIFSPQGTVSSQSLTDRS